VSQSGKRQPHEPRAYGGAVRLTGSVLLRQQNVDPGTREEVPSGSLASLQSGAPHRAEKLYQVRKQERFFDRHQF
jgi:hypothetical protein